MAELKTKVTKGSVNKFLDSIADEAKRKDSYLLFKMMQKATKNEARLWGDSIIGFGDYHYVGKSGREGGWEQHDELLAKLGKYSLGKGCLYIKRLDDVDMSILNQLIVEAVKRAKKQAQADAKMQAKSNK